MAKLIYASNMSLDGWTEDTSGGFNWAPPDDDVFAFITGIMASAGTYLYGRRMYDVMRYWATAPATGDGPAVGRDFAGIWQAADKVVYSTTLEAPSTPRTRLEREFDGDPVRDMVSRADRDVGVGGSALAGQALADGLVDEVHLYLTPVIVGGGTRALPDDLRLDLHLLDHHRFRGGVVLLRYRVAA